MKIATLCFFRPGPGLVPSTSVFRMREFNSLMSDLREVATTVVVDSPPLLAAAESLDIAARADGIVMVVSRGASLAGLEEAADRVALSGKPILGYIFNRAGRDRGKYGSYGYGYGYGETQT